MNSTDDKMLDYITFLLKKYLYHPIGLLVGMALIIFIVPKYLDDFLQKGIDDFFIRSLVYVALIVLWFIVWYFLKTNLPVNKYEKIGFFVALTTESDKQKLRIKNDFIRQLRQEVARNNLLDLINIIHAEGYKAGIVVKVIEEYINKKKESLKNASIDFKSSKENKKFQKLRKKTKCHYFLYGSVKERLAEENMYFFNINSIVSHYPIDFELQSKIAKSFNRIFPKERFCD